MPRKRQGKRNYGSGAAVKRGTKFTRRLSQGFDVDGKRIRIEFSADTQEELDKQVKDYQRQVKAGVDFDQSKQSLREYFEEWLPTYSANRDLRSTTVTRYQTDMRPVLQVIGNIAIGRITTRHIDKAISTPEKRENRRSNYPTEVTQGMRARRAKILRMMLSYAERTRAIEHNPMRWMDSVRQPKTEEQRFLDMIELQMLIEHARDQGIGMMVELQLHLGCRIGELLALKLSDIDWTADPVTGYASIRIQRQFVEDNGTLRIHRPKTEAGNRTISISPAYIAKVEQHIKDVEARNVLHGYGNPDNWLFPSFYGQAFRYGVYNRTWRKVVDGSGITSPEQVGTHTLRHSAVAHWLATGDDLYVISKRLGHERYGTTVDLYGHLVPSRASASVTAFDALL